VIRVFEAGEPFAPDLPRGCRVAVKPNLTYPTHRPGVTTTPAVLRAVVERLVERANQVFVVESDGGYGAWDCERALRGHGVPEMCAALGAAVINLSAAPRTSLAVSHRGVLLAIPFPRMLLDSIDAFVSVPVPKVHCMTGVSLAMKNQWGLIPDPLRLEHHHAFDEVVLEINRRLPAATAIVDGTYFLDENGPMEGRPLRKDLLITADSIGECDRYLCALMGVDPMGVSHLRHAIAAGFVPGILDEMTFDTEQLRRLSYRAVLKRTPRQALVRTFFHSRRLTRLMYTSSFGRGLHRVYYKMIGKEGWEPVGQEDRL
jgi:uncharacterized protein (DUF362 family)